MATAAPNPAVPPLARPVTSLYGVGPERTAQLARLQIHSVEDLLLHRPRRHEDRRRFQPLAELKSGEAAITRGTVIAQGVKWFAKHTKSVFELILDDGTARLHCRWWNLPYMEKYFAVGDEVLVYGKLVNLKPRTIDHPETEVIETGVEELIHLNRLTPVYPLTEGLPQRWLRSLIWRTLQDLGPQIPDPWPELGSPEGGGLSLTRAQAIHRLHFPEAPEEIELARQRLALDEFAELQRQIRLRRANFESKARALPCGGNNRLMKPFLAALGFGLTPAQTRVLREIRKDLRGAHPMRRLLQGDVGSGKTLVAACSALMALESGFGVAVMAPTEILAEQHYQNFTRWFQPFGIEVRLQTGSRRIGPGSGEATAAAPLVLTVGTHALIEEGFSPKNLGLVIIDEQHKFGVAQREQLLRKGLYPHLLVMTATPIPRTLGLTIYGDLDVSVIDELPPGRGAVQTFVRTPETLPKVWAFVRQQLDRGRQAYIVYPRVEDAGAGEVKAVTREFEAVQRALAPHRTGLLHGRLKAGEKQQTVQAFRANALQALLATSLVEVGLDVANATVMLIENAEQFGLAQLHQLRGRIGRGAQRSYCILLSGARTPEALQRLRTLEQTQDGFRVAEADLQQRGPGELLGQQQSGLPGLRFGDLAKDWRLIERARRWAAQHVNVA